MNKYSNVDIQIKEMWKLQCIKIVLVIITVKSLTTRALIQSMKMLDLTDVLVVSHHAQSNRADLSYYTEVPNCITVTLATEMLCNYMRIG